MNKIRWKKKYAYNGEDSMWHSLEGWGRVATPLNNGNNANALWVIQYKNQKRKFLNKNQIKIWDNVLYKARWITTI